MPRKKPKLSEKEIKELERKRQEDAEKQRFLENERLRDKLAKEEREHAMRKAMLDVTIKHFEKIKQQMKLIRKSEKEERLWRKYLDPEATPDPSSPPDLRSYLYKWELNEMNENKNKIDPRLFFNERSILSQNMDAPDLRLKQFQVVREQIGDKYLTKVRQVLTINDELKDFMDSEGRDLPDKLFNDLKELQVLFRKKLVNFLDKWSFEVLSDIDRDMTITDPITAEYNYHSQIVNQSLWTFREVPLPPNYSQVNFITMKACNSEFTKSNLMDLASVCLRCIMVKYDHFSDFTPTHKILVHIPETHDLKTELQNERILVLELVDKKLSNMREIRIRFEEEKKRLAEEEADMEKVMKQGAKDEKKKGKQRKKKLHKNAEIELEPPIVDENTFVDVSDELQKVLKEKFMQEKERLDPINLNLESNEIHLREMIVLGGVYSYNLLQRPRQTRILKEDFLITLINQPDTLRYSDFFYDYKESPRPRLSLMHLDSTRRQSIFPKNLDVHQSPEHRRTLYIQERRTTAQILDFEEEQKRWVSENEINQKSLFEIRIKIPDDVYWWEPPSVCRWEPWEESDSFKQLTPAMQNYNLNYEKVLEDQQRKLFSAPPIKRDFKSIKKLQDTKLSEVNKTLPSHYFITDYILPRMIDDYKFAEEIRDDMEKEAKEKENRLKMRKEAIERERKRIAEELVQKRIEEVSKGVPRETRVISFDEPKIMIKLLDAGTQTETFKDSHPKRVSQLRKNSSKLEEMSISSISKRSSISSMKVSVNGNSSNGLKQVEDANELSQKSSISHKMLSQTPIPINANRVSISVQTEKVSTASLQRSIGTSSLRHSRTSSISSKSGSNKSRKSRTSISSVSLTPKVVINVEEDESIDVGSQSPLIIQARSSFIPSFVQVVPESTPPKLLFTKRKRLKPLEVIKGLEEKDSLQSIQLRDILSTISGGFDEDNATISEFLAYLEELQEKEKPFFHSDSYINRVMEQLAAKNAESMADTEAKKLKELQHQLRISKILEARQRESTFYRVPRKSIAEVTKSRVWRELSREERKRRKSKNRRSSLGSSKDESLSTEISSKNETARVRLHTPESFVEEPLHLIPHFPGKWTKNHVYCETFNPDTKYITFKAGRFGSFGLFTSKYVNFPFKSWNINPNGKQGDLEEVVLTLEVKYTTVEFRISSKGYKVGLHLRTKSFMTELVPIISDFTSFQKLKEKLISVNANVFPEADACYYIPNISEKFEALEDHCNKCVAMFCLTHEFKSCHWNRYSDYRNILLNSKCLRNEPDGETRCKEVLVTPLKSEFVHVSQKCSTEICDVELRFTPNPPHQDFNADLYHLLMGETLSSRKTFDNTDPILQWNMFELLSAIKIFSFTQ